MTENKTEEEPVEILHLAKEVMQEGSLYFKEISYISDHTVFSRTSMMPEDGEETGWTSKGWKQETGPDGQPLCWREKEALDLLAIKAEKKNWTVTWHPAYNSAMSEYIKSIKF